MPAKTAGLLFWLLVGGLAAVAIYWQLRHPSQLPPVNASPQQPVELPVITPIPLFQLPLRQQYDDIIARPIFIPTRRPEPPPPPEEEPVPPSPPPTAPEQKFLLFGVIIAPGTQAALLRLEEPNAKTARVRQGEKLGEWLLEAVFPNRVVLRKEQMIQEVGLYRPRPPKPRAGRTAARPPLPIAPSQPATSAPPMPVPAPAAAPPLFGAPPVAIPAPPAQ